MIADQTQLWLTQFHEILTKKGGNFSHLTTSLSPLTLLPFSRYGGRRGMFVSIP